MELTNKIRKAFASLSSAKGRRETGLFMAQGTKCVHDTLGAFALEALLCTHAWAQEHPTIAREATIVKSADLERISSLSTAPEVIAIYRLPQDDGAFAVSADKLTVALDCVQDPGNVGTILRVCDWMGVTDVVASEDTADVFSPKVVQATMGAISRVRVHYCNLAQLLGGLSGRMAVYGTFLDGEDIYKTDLTASGIVVMGNEGRGISDAVAASVDRRLLIPSFAGGTTSESLNVAVATAITLSEFRRRHG